MIRLRDISIRRKLTLIIMIASAVAVLLVASGFVTYELLTHRKVMTRDATTLAQIVADQSTAALVYDDRATAEEILGALKARENIVAAGLFKNGSLFAQYATQPDTVLTLPEAPVVDGAWFADDHLLLLHVIRLQGEPIGVLYLKSDLKEMHERLARYATIVGVILLVTFLATYLLAQLLQRYISKPIFNLAETAKTVSSKKNYRLRAVKTGNDELGQLIDGFNEMLGQIEQRDTMLQQTNDILEVRVKERTRALQSEIDEHRRTEASLERQFRRTSLLNQITQVISERQDLDSILHVVLRQLEDNLNLDFGCVTLFDPESSTLNVSALRLKNSTLASKLRLREGSVFALDQSGLRQCLDGQTVYVADAVKTRAEFPEMLAGVGLCSLVAVPLLVEQKLFGLMVASRLEPDSFSSGDCEFLRMLSEHVALAAHQARLYKQLETAYNELRETQQTAMQQERLKALGQMASGIAHDVNNALSPIVGFAELILRGEHGLTVGGRKYMQHIRTAGEDIAHIVARLREFYRKREETISYQKLNLNELVGQVVDMTRPRWRDISQSNGATVEVITELEPDIPPCVGIESEMREALTNLVLNAVDAMPLGGKIRIRTCLEARPSQDSETTPETRIIMEVIDSGVGMDEETRKRCLEPFYSTKGKRGTGLGLAMVYGVMDRHDGSVEIESKLGHGTTIRLIMPVRGEPATRGAEVSADAPIQSLRILCIDDEPLLRELLKEILEYDGHKVEVSDGGQSGLDAFRLARHQGGPFDVVITDLGMPYVDGRQVAKTIKEESPETPVIMLTGWGALMKEEGESPVEVDGVLSKPPRSKELREALARFKPAREACAA